MNREKVIEKIKALLNKTVDNGCSEEEMGAALDKARAWMDAHEITEDELRLTKEEEAVLRSEPPDSLDPHNIKWHLMDAVAEFCNCQVWQKRRRDTKVVEFCGLQSDARLASWLLDTLAQFVQAEIVRHLMETLPPKGEKRRVIRGFVRGLHRPHRRIASTSSATSQSPPQRLTGASLCWLRTRPSMPR